MTTKKDQLKTEAKGVEVKLKKPHTHAGDDFDAGATITVSSATADWLKANGIATDK